jgi:hypothetical protein
MECKALPRNWRIELHNGVTGNRIPHKPLADPKYALRGVTYKPLFTRECSK